jgi:hypothetical protein
MKHTLPNKVGLPTGSYVHLRVELRSAPVVCANCGNSGLLYAHIVKHARIGEVQVGKICASRLTGNPFVAEARERACRFRETRRARWAVREWKRAKSGVSYASGDGVSLITYPVKGGFSAIITSLLNDFKIVGRRVFATEKEAQEVAVRVLLHSWLDVGAK